ncbi:MAG TPA: spermidine/putrescine ABC transporter substrate-binding protein [Acidimicrobiia bacterium]|nr:spermidine/putrescine ABC transporter substrate-binding protein [Acidimicrobiia bacterium]
MSSRSRNRLVMSRMNRRQFLGRAGVFAGAVALGPSVLAACGDDDEPGSSGTTGTTVASKTLVISNWPLYIDPTEDGVTGSVDLFAEATGLDVTYTEDINDNNELFATIQPVLSQGNRIDQDIIVPTGWMAARLIRLGWLEELPFDEIPNAANLTANLQNPAWDPDGKYSLPWQSGFAGIAYNLEAAGRELRSTEDLFDPEFAGKIGFLSEMRDSLGLVYQAEGKNLADITFDDAQDALDRIEAAARDGQIRQFTGNDYQDDLVAGNFVACVGWSGDVVQLALDNPNLRFVIPEEGGTLWSDTMVVPKGARNIANAAKWMDYCYDPENAARIAAWVNYISPVDGVREILATDPETAALAESELMFPADDVNVTAFPPLDDEQEQQFDERWATITEGA